MGIIAINKTVPRKLKISFLSMRNENEWIPSSKYQMASAIKNEIAIRTIGKMRQQYLFVSIRLRILKTKDKIKPYSFVLIIADLITEFQTEKYPSAPFERLVFGFAGAADPGLLFTNS